MNTWAQSDKTRLAKLSLIVEIWRIITQNSVLLDESWLLGFQSDFDKDLFYQLFSPQIEYISAFLNFKNIFKTNKKDSIVSSSLALQWAVLCLKLMIRSEPLE